MIRDTRSHYRLWKLFLHFDTTGSSPTKRLMGRQQCPQFEVQPKASMTRRGLTSRFRTRGVWDVEHDDEVPIIAMKTFDCAR
jgi:hypothetical protein